MAAVDPQQAVKALKSSISGECAALLIQIAAIPVTVPETPAIKAVLVQIVTMLSGTV